MKTNKRVQQLSKKGEDIISVLTKTEAELEAHIDETVALGKELEAEIVEKERQADALISEAVQYDSILSNIRKLLGKD